MGNSVENKMREPIVIVLAARAASEKKSTLPDPPPEYTMGRCESILVRLVTCALFPVSPDGWWYC
ncbi:hypothetical protein KKF84_15575 [Myxococcota bacterium]|nr:hypothetical protein [Myxococcota bacterium]MBU1536744.1 hypothetical protein [Myxococcota bacterium]